MQKIFTCDGYDFWRDGSGHWNVAHKGDGPPSHCAYATPDAIATLKGVNLRAGMEWHRTELSPDHIREAAPDMLAALKDAEKWLAEVADCYSPHTIPDNMANARPYIKARDKCRAAIAKAEGRA